MSIGVTIPQFRVHTALKLTASQGSEDCGLTVYGSVVSEYGTTLRFAQQPTSRQTAAKLAWLLSGRVNSRGGSGF